MAEEEMEYESDPEEAKLSLKMRRKEASDDEEEEEEAGNGQERERDRREKPTPRGGIDSDAESDGQGGVAEYDDEELEVDEEEEEVEYYEEEEVLMLEEYEEGRDGEIGGASGGDDVGEQGEGEGHEAFGEKDVEIKRGIGDASEVQGLMIGQSQLEEGKKDSEPFAVPTAGAFYMHDDRFRDNAGGRHRRTFGGRKLWESKDDRKWGHDKFEEMNMQERHFEEGRRSSRGHYRGRGRGRGADRGFARGNRSRAYDGNNNQNLAPRAVRGRGPRRYTPSKSENGMTVTQNKQLEKPHEKTSHVTPGRNNAAATNVEPEQAPAKKVVSSLNSASRPFYPSGFPKEEITLTQKRDVQAGSVNRTMRPPLTEDGFSVQQSNSSLQGKTTVDSVGMDKLYIDDSVSTAVASKQLNNFHMPTASSSMIQGPQSKTQGRSVSLTRQTSFQPIPTHNQVNKLLSPAQVHTAQRNPIQGRSQPSAEQLGQHPVLGAQGSPPKSSSSISAVEPGDSESTPESRKSKGALVGKGKGIVQGGGRGAVLYGGAQVMGSGGNMGAGHVDPKFPATPAFLPVMQFGSQHPGGIGVPAVGMAFPGYVAQPQLGLGNSEMTWLPVLAGAAGALGATYCSPYIAVDGAYHDRSTGQTSALATSSKDSNGNKASSDWKHPQKSELSNDEFSQRQNKPRRYSEMNFGQ
ncbi:hypothetical protein Ancab_029459 [Ancistrocladus abbreviatus]